MVDLASQLRDLPARRGKPPWPDHEYVKGWGVFGLSLDSGHVLALRVFPENDFSPYRTVWHRDPSGRWSIYVDGPRLDTACPPLLRPSVHPHGPRADRHRLDRAHVAAGHHGHASPRLDPPCH